MAKKNNSSDLDIPYIYSVTDVNKDNDEPKMLTPSNWFNKEFPGAAQTYGAGFLERYHEQGGVKWLKPTHLIDDAWAAALEGDRDLGLWVVYFPPEDQFYFYDYRPDAFCPVSEERLELVLSNHLIRCAEQCAPNVDVRPLVDDFREHRWLKKVVTKAKLILAVEQDFFEGATGQRRFKDGRYVELDTKPTFRLFAENALTLEPGAGLPVNRAYEYYKEICKSRRIHPSEMREFRETMAPIIHDIYRKGIRNDIADEKGKQQQGWADLGLRDPSMDEIMQN
jgi:hypothetical protein